MNPREADRFAHALAHAEMQHALRTQRPSPRRGVLPVMRHYDDCASIWGEPGTLCDCYGVTEGTDT